MTCKCDQGCFHCSFECSFSESPEKSPYVSVAIFCNIRDFLRISFQFYYYLIFCFPNSLLHIFDGNGNTTPISEEEGAWSSTSGTEEEETPQQGSGNSIPEVVPHLVILSNVLGHLNGQISLILCLACFSCTTAHIMTKNSNQQHD